MRRNRQLLAVTSGSGSYSEFLTECGKLISGCAAGFLEKTGQMATGDGRRIRGLCGREFRIRILHIHRTYGSARTRATELWRAPLGLLAHAEQGPGGGHRGTGTGHRQYSARRCGGGGAAAVPGGAETASR